MSAVNVRGAQGGGTFSRSPISCVSKTTTGAVAKLDIAWKGSVKRYKAAPLTPSAISAGTATGSFPGDAKLSLPMPTQACAHRRIKKLTLVGTITLLDPSSPTGTPTGTPPGSPTPTPPTGTPNPDPVATPTPSPVQGLLPGAVSVASNGQGFCALLASGQVSCWGSSGGGQLGDGDTGGPDTCVGFGKNHPVPCSTSAVSTGITATSLESSGSGYCAILTSGEVDCWGSNGYGAVGDGTSSGPDTCYGVACATTPVSIGITATSLARSDSNTCAILTSGQVDCWGYNLFGQLGDGTHSGPETCAGLPCGTAPSSTGIDATSVVGGGVGYCAILPSSAVDCWGQNQDGQLGDGTATGPDDCYYPAVTTQYYYDPPLLSYCSPSPVGTGIDATRLASNGSGYCAILTSGGVDCWGLNDAGELGDGLSSGPDTCQTSPSFTLSCSTSPVPTGITATSIVGGDGGYCAILTSGGVDCWGDNNYGQVGDGTATGPDSCGGLPCATTPVPIGIDATSVDIGPYDHCAVLTSGGVDCWGNNVVGQLGNGNNGGPETCAFSQACSTTPLATGISATSLASGSGEDPNYCAVLLDSTVDCWGGNAVGELGNGTSANYVPG